MIKYEDGLSGKTLLHLRLPAQIEVSPGPYPANRALPELCI